eukprot:CAMPEP_0178838396 /NCGR_PEP_ID=MMETSP0746-20121128/13290_1 /TAXON_ID=913974 /ORGANISM="Nitzschia punctata, Strain CCMP561" /LENGTH=69 /DNA_ID=CAMNT_0020501339 /DNA_START=266 /DNA_END=475 /DNA_ORIENTATION=-
MIDNNNNGMDDESERPRLITFSCKANAHASNTNKDLIGYCAAAADDDDGDDDDSVLDVHCCAVGCFGRP